MLVLRAPCAWQPATDIFTPAAVQTMPAVKAAMPAADSSMQMRRRLHEVAGTLPGLAEFKQQAPAQLQKELEQLGVQTPASPSPQLSLQDLGGRKLLAAESAVAGLASYTAQAPPELQQQLAQLGVPPAAASPAPTPHPMLQDITMRKLLQAAEALPGLAAFAATQPPNVQQQLALLGAVPASPSPSPVPSPLLGDIKARRLLLEQAPTPAKVGVVPGLQAYAQQQTPQVQAQLAQLGMAPPAAPAATQPAPATLSQVAPPPAGTPPAPAVPPATPPAENGTSRVAQAAASAP